MLYYDHASRATTVVDGRETAPAQASESLFIDSDGKPVGFEKAVIGGRAVGVPGAVAALALLHQRFGKLPWPRLFDDAIALARDGFELSPRLHKLLLQEHYLRRDPVATVIDGCVGCGLCGENAHAAVLCPSFYRAEVVQNPGAWDRFMARLRMTLTGFFMPRPAAGS